MNQKTKTLVIIVIVGVILVSLVSAGVFKAGMLLAVTNIEIDPSRVGSEIGGEWQGTYWVVTLSVDIGQGVTYFKLDSSNAGQFNKNTQSGQTLLPTATVEIWIQRSVTAWYEAPLERDSSKWPTGNTYTTVAELHNEVPRERYKVEMAPNGYPPDPAPSQPLIYETLDSPTGFYWERHTPFDVVVKKSLGANNFETTTYSFDTIAGQNSFTLINPLDPTGKEQILLYDIGALSSPIEEKQISDFSIPVHQLGQATPPIVYRRDTNFLNILENDAVPTGTYRSFSYDWWGDYRWTTGTGSTFNTPRVPKSGTSWNLDSAFLSSHTKSWAFTSGDYYDPGDPGTVYYEKGTPKQPTLNDVDSYLNSKSLEKVNLDIYGAGYSISGDRVKIYTTYPSVEVITLWISSELADTVVYSPGIAEPRIDSATYDDGSTNRQISGSVGGTVKVTNIGTATGTINIWAEILGSGNVEDYMIVNPMASAPTLDPNAQYIMPFTVMNLGVTAQMTGTIRWHAKSPLSNIESTADLGFTLIVDTGILCIWTEGEEPPNSGRIYVDGVEKTRNLGTTYTEVVPVGTYSVSFGPVNGFVTPDGISATVQKGQKRDVVGVYVSILPNATLLRVWVTEGTMPLEDAYVSIFWSGSSTDKPTDANGRVEWDLGDYVGDVDVRVQKWGYTTEQETVTVHLGLNEFAYTLESNWLQYLQLVLLGCVAVGVAFVVVFSLQKKKRKWH